MRIFKMSEISHVHNKESSDQHQLCFWYKINPDGSQTLALSRQHSLLPVHMFWNILMWHAAFKSQERMFKRHADSTSHQCDASS
jgi:hypothetical protein